MKWLRGLIHHALVNDAHDFGRKAANRKMRAAYLKFSLASEASCVGRTGLFVAVVGEWSQLQAAGDLWLPSAGQL
jgi:hypothetical protein